MSDVTRAIDVPGVDVPRPGPVEQENLARLQVRIRPEVLALPRYVPGKSLPGAVKLSSNENPAPPARAVIDAAAHALESVNRYPDLGSVALRAALSDHLGVGVDRICCGTGSSGVLSAALSVVCHPGSEVVYPWRSFESYPIAVPAAGGTPRPVALASDAGPDLEALAAAVGPDTVALIVCSPNNPTGPARTLGQVTALLDRVPPEVLVILDEAYIELATAPGVTSAVPLVADHPNLLVLRTFSKVYALAGLRVGYGVGHPDLIAAISAVSVPFGVSSVAQAAALRALADQDAMRASARAVVAERERVSAALRDAGYDVPDSQANFVWLSARQSGPSFVQACTEAGLVVRPFPEGVRVTVGTPSDNDRFLDVARSFRVHS